MDFSEQEEKILKYWKENWIFYKTLKKDSPEGDFVFYEGPPTANGKPGIHHVEARAFKDLIPRYKTMRGYRVMRKAGWDTHGLPVELEVEKKLGLKKKKDVEEYGMGEFNQKCKQSVWEYKEDWEKMTERIGYWVDMADPYITYDNDYIESLWWIISEAHKKDLLYQGYKVIPNCPRCGTALSSHEVAQGYRNITEESVYIKFKVKNSKSSKLEAKSYILAWTTTPWTLPGNVALAIGEDIEYVKIKQNDEYYYLAKNLLDKIEGAYEVVEKLKGKDLVGLEYEPLFSGIITEKHENYKNAYKIYPASFVSTEDGTGVVHTAVMYGVEDYELGEKIGLPKEHTVNLDGTFNALVPKWEGKFVKSVEKEIIEDLKKRKLLYKTEDYAHDYPFCWRCGTPLIYYAKDSWFFEMSKLRNDLIKNNSKINWIPAHIKEGRFGEWLREVKDWSISRERYWGTPIPVWKCEKCDEVKVVSSVEEIRENLGGYNNLFITRHGESENNVAFINNSMPETQKFPLTERGRKEAKKTALEFKNKKIDIIVSSPIMRAKETAEIISKELGVEIVFDEKIREVDLGEFNNKDYDDLHTMYPNKMARAENTSHGVESGEDMKKRLEGFLGELNNKYENKNIVLVSHADVCQILFGITKGAGLRESYKLWYPGTGEAKHVYSRQIDLHRPFIDKVELDCQCGGKMKRIPEVMDCWFDSGSMPFAQYHYPFENKEAVDEGTIYPADFISEAIDQTRGWFYTLLAVSTILGKGAPYKNVISLGHVLDSKGHKMSKSKGNVVDPMAMIDKYGADTLRWYLYTINQPGDAVLFDEKGLKVSRRMFMTLVNVLAFYKMFASTNLENLKKNDLTHVLDVWINSKFNVLAREVTENLDKYDITTSARKIENFINDLSTWYIRRSRDRFKNGDEKAMRVLRRILFNLAKLLAPFAPFTSEYVYQEMAGREKTTDDEQFDELTVNFVESVHLKSWPEVKGKPVDEDVICDMEEVRKIVPFALDLRLKAGIKVRQPLQELKVKSQKLKGKEEFLQLIKDEINIKEVFCGADIKSEVELDTNITDDLKEEGMTRELMRQIQGHRKKLGLEPGEQAEIEIFADEEGRKLIEKNEKALKDLNIKSFKFTEEKNDNVLLCLYN